MFYGHGVQGLGYCRVRGFKGLGIYGLGSIRVFKVLRG